MKQLLYPVLDRPHGINVAGKGSPASLVPFKYADDDALTFREWEWGEAVLDLVADKLQMLGWEYFRVVADNDPNCPGLNERIRRINAVPENIIVTVSMHNNASKMGDTWEKARGVALFTSKGQTGSDPMATRLFNLIKIEFPEMNYYSDFSDGDPDLEANFYALVARGFAVLLEFGFQDNKLDVAFLKLASTKERISNVIVEWLKDENARLLLKNG